MRLQLVFPMPNSASIDASLGKADAVYIQYKMISLMVSICTTGAGEVSFSYLPYGKKCIG